MVQPDFYREVLQQIEVDEEPSAFGAYFRDLLIDTTLNGIAENQVPELVARAVELALWSPTYALDIAAHISDAGRKVRMYAALLKTDRLSEHQRHDTERAALDALHADDFESGRFHSLLELIPGLDTPARAQALVEAVDLAFQLDAHEDSYQSAVWALAPQYVFRGARTVYVNYAGRSEGAGYSAR
jgi:hypothetical protein